MNKKRLLFINGHLNTGGVEKSLLDILVHLDYDKYEVDLLLTEELGDYSYQLPKQVNVSLRSLNGAYGTFANVVRSSFRHRDWFSLKMRLIILFIRLFGISKISLAKKMLTDGKKYDCVIGFRRGICTQIAAYAVNAKRRLTWWHHGTFNVESEAYLKEASKCNNIIAVSNACRDMLCDTIPSLENRILVIHNMLDGKIIKERATLFTPEFDPSKIHIVSVGGLVPEKHFENAIYAAKKLKEQKIDFLWHLIGDGVEREKLQSLAGESNVADVFLFEGNQVNPYPYMYHADLFVHPSYVESFGIVVAEALSLGRACVVTKSAGVMDFLVDGKNAVLTEQSADDLAEQVLKVLQDVDLQNNLRIHAKCPVEFGHDSIMAEIDKVLLENI